ncbi:MAG: glycoside hydrolase family 95 protein [Lachnospiraceae bacterium]|nr:glycoside hydrolase family 95 protein [Lachnospiraceae bacterium]
MSRESLLIYDKAAQDFDHALPIGNGRMGAMIYGGVKNELIGLNEDSVWSGGKRNRTDPQAKNIYKRIRELLSQGHVKEAEKLCVDRMMGIPSNCRHYMPLPDLHIEHDIDEANVSDYRLSLDISKACAQVSFTCEGVRYRREYFMSYPAAVLAVRISSDKPGSVSLKAYIDGRDDYYDDNRPVADDMIRLNGGCGGKDGISFACALKMVAEEGARCTEGIKLAAYGCDSVTLYLGARTNFYTASYMDECVNDVARASARGFDALFSEHLEDYTPIYDRCRLELPSNEGLRGLFTDERIERLKNDPSAYDTGLAELYFNYGRYLMISGSRPGTLPLNLQGIWNKDSWPAWGGRYTININTEMNYWPAEVTALPEFHLPLFVLLERMREDGRRAAREMYGCRGFMAHHNTDLWGDCAPQDIWVPATVWPMGAAWLCLHIMEHYRFTQDKDFLRRMYPTLTESCIFFEDYMFEDEKGRLLTGPSLSPENTYISSTLEQGNMCNGPSMDSQIIRQLFTDAIDAAAILGCADDHTKKLAQMLTKLPPIRVGKYGQIMEWAEDYDEAEPGHRHISQLFALYPSDQIDIRKTPELAKAARATLERRLSHGGGHTGWSRAWIINFWARLGDARKVSENITLLLSRSTNMNMLDSHPPFQIDGNFGGCAGIAEALLQSHGKRLTLLPALPDEWSSGYVSGLKARGGFTVDMSWDNGLLTSAEVTALSDNVCTISYRLPFTVSMEGADVALTESEYGCSFTAAAGKTYTITLS